MLRHVRFVTPLALLGAMLAGCTFVNLPLNPDDTAANRRRVNQTHAAIRLSSDVADASAQSFSKDGWFVGIAISGGGSRSANYSAAVMFELQRLGLLEKVDAISSVSGGSLTAAYYC